MQTQRKSDHVYVNIDQRLTRLHPLPSESCIFRVHTQLRSVNDKAYTPDIIAIGPHHRGEKRLLMMEEVKLHYMQLLLQRNKEQNLIGIVNEMRKLEKEARSCYAEPINLESNEFVDMMVADACFILELFLKFEEPKLRNDPVFRMDWMVSSLQRDLMLFENQLPFFVLLKIFEMIQGPNQPKKLVSLAWRFFRDILPCTDAKNISENSIEPPRVNHLLGLIHAKFHPRMKISGSISNNNKNNNNEGNFHYIGCASELGEAGVEFQKAEGSESLFAITFKNGIMKIPSFVVEDRSEALFRNLIAYEQYCLDTHYIFDYVNLMVCLMNTPKDVEILCDAGVVDNWLADDKVVSTIFNKLTDAVTWPSGPFYYENICEAAEIHCSKRLNRWMASLRRNYMNTPWAILSLIVAFILLAFTFLQTLYSILAYYKRD